MEFRQAIEIILPYEGGYNNDPNDKGGETNFGISKRSYPDLNIKSITREYAIKIYLNDYWNRFKLDQYPSNLRLQIFDMCINSGSTSAIKILQRAINMVTTNSLTVDGIAGQKTIDATKNYFNFINTYICIQRIVFYNKLVKNDNSQIKFLIGWTDRAIDMLQKS